MSRDDRERLRDILESLNAIEDYVGGDLAEPRVDAALVLDAVLFRLIVIGEAVKHLGADLLDGAREVRWRDVAGLRDVIAHQYFRIQAGIVEDTVRRDLPGLRAATVRLLG